MKQIVAGVALGLVLVASQASAQAPTAAVRPGVTSGVQRASVKMVKTNKAVEGATVALITFTVVGGVIVYEATNNNESTKSP